MPTWNRAIGKGRIETMRGGVNQGNSHLARWIRKGGQGVAILGKH